MSLSASTLASDIKTQVMAIPGISITDSSELQAFCTAVATAVVNHIKSNAVVNPGSMANSGGSLSGTGTVS